QHPKDIALLNHYLRLTSQQSLKTYIFAQLEFNETMEIRNYYSHPEINKENGLIRNVDHEIPDDILKLMPRYRDRVRAAMQDEISSSDDEHPLNLNDDAALASYQLLNQDQTTLKNLSQEIENYIV